MKQGLPLLDPSKVQLFMSVDVKSGPRGTIAITGFENLEAAIMRGDFDEELGIADLPEEMTLEELEELNNARPELGLPLEKHRQQQRIQDWLEQNGFRYKALPGGGERKELTEGEAANDDIAHLPEPESPDQDPPDLIA